MKSEIPFSQPRCASCPKATAFIIIPYREEQTGAQALGQPSDEHLKTAALHTFFGQVHV